MDMRITHIFVTVESHEKGLEYYVGTLGFKKTWDLAMPGGWRWLTVSPAGMHDCNLVLTPADKDQERGRIGCAGAPPRMPLLILDSDDFAAVYEDWKEKGVAFDSEPSTMPWGTMATFCDPWGNQMLLMQSNPDFTEGMLPVP